MKRNIALFGLPLISTSILIFSDRMVAQEYPQDYPLETINLEILQDDPTAGKAELSGLIRLLFIDNPDERSRTLTKTGNNWLFKATISARRQTEAPFYSLQTESQYIGGGNSHPLLQTPLQNIDDASIINPNLTPGPERADDVVIGNGTIYQLTSLLIDVNPNRPGFGEPTGIDGDFARTISAQFGTERIPVPEPAFVLGFALLSGFTLMKQRKKEQ